MRSKKLGRTFYGPPLNFNPTTQLQTMLHANCQAMQLKTSRTLREHFDQSLAIRNSLVNWNSIAFCPRVLLQQVLVEQPRLLVQIILHCSKQDFSIALRFYFLPPGQISAPPFYQTACAGVVSTVRHF
jgi:hypothetical protein